VKAYEKDATTGIVRHLDDQCIGCQYCMLKCPYEVPKYSKRLGIVRKCDMCQQRLAVGEAPACVQACPTSAIRIVLHDTGATALSRVPGIMPEGSAEYTRPTTAYTTARTLSGTRAADADVPRVQPTHWPLVGMLLLTQLAAGLFIAAIPYPQLAWAGIASLMLGLGVSAFHLGRPLGAWRFFLGLRTSWMSREILAFSVFAALAIASLLALPTFLPAMAGMVAVFTSAMIYIDTRRSWWSAKRTSLSFIGTTARLGGSCAAAITGDIVCSVVALLFGLISILLEAKWDRHHSLSQRILNHSLPALKRWKGSLVLLAIFCQAAALLLPGGMGWTAFLCNCAACLAERVIFFRAVDAPKMPGGLAA
jgi:DMSO reductase anchor subunit/NAD-dependent dihydropyrimidine dehydrogenase PreA subunit